MFFSDLHLNRNTSARRLATTSALPSRDAYLPLYDHLPTGKPRIVTQPNRRPLMFDRAAFGPRGLA